MYYEEKLINGVLMYRSMPNGVWRQCSIEKMGQRIVEQGERIAELESALRAIRGDSDDCFQRA